MTHLKAVSTNLPEPPYPEDTKANGYKLEIDWQRIKASRTWRLCPIDVRNALFRLWMESWNEVPVGSWEKDDELIAVSIDVPYQTFNLHKEILMRGWGLHSDGRYYHPYVTKKVLEMLEKRSKSTIRQKRYRANESSGSVTRESRVTNAMSHVTYAKEQEQDQDKKKKNTKKEKVPPCPYKKIRDLWVHALPSLPEPLDVELWTPARKAKMRERWLDQLPSLEHWERTFEYIQQSKFLMGKAQSNGRKPFQCSIDWIIKPDNLMKLYEGKYDG